MLVYSKDIQKKGLVDDNLSTPTNQCLEIVNQLKKYFLVFISLILPACTGKGFLQRGQVIRGFFPKKSVAAVNRISILIQFRCHKVGFLSCHLSGNNNNLSSCNFSTSF